MFPAAGKAGSVGQILASVLPDWASYQRWQPLVWRYCQLDHRDGVLQKELLEHLRAKRMVRRARYASLKRNGLG